MGQCLFIPLVRFMLFFLPILAASLLTSSATLFATPDTPHRWTIGDFGGVLSVGLEGYRDFSVGKAKYKAACAECHALGPFSGGDASNLTRRALTYTPEELLGHLLNPAIHEPRPLNSLNGFTQAELLDLLAFVLSGADAQSPFFYRP
jgi:hypothetical protein